MPLRRGIPRQLHPLNLSLPSPRSLIRYYLITRAITTAFSFAASDLSTELSLSHPPQSTALVKLTSRSSAELRDATALILIHMFSAARKNI